jgi:hypothetical protein
VAAPDLFFTYMSHQFPRLIGNRAHVEFLNSMHGIRLHHGIPDVAKEALPLVALNSLTMLGAELGGRSYGGGVLKMEPSEARALPVPKLEHLKSAWNQLKKEREQLDHQLRSGRWTPVVARIDQVLLQGVMGLADADLELLRSAAAALRARRMARVRGRTRSID